MDNQVKFYLVGGAVRDQILGIPCKDLDYTVTGCSSYEELGEYLTSTGFDIVHRYEDKFTFRCKVPSESLMSLKAAYVDIVWARKDGEYIDGDMVSCEPGTLYDDLQRRDFTINAMAIDVETKFFIDPFNGQSDLSNKILRCVGSPSERFGEDPRRFNRGLRFMVKYNLNPSPLTEQSYRCWSEVSLLKNPKYLDKTKEELDKAFKCNTGRTLVLLNRYGTYSQAVFSNNRIHLVTSSKS